MLPQNQLRRSLSAVALFGITLCLALQPWRAVVGQDDASYAFFADSLKAGDWRPPDLLLAAAWPQSVAGAAFSSLTPMLPSLRSYMLLTFLVFLSNCFLFLFQSREGKNVQLWVALFFIFPVTLQYGIAFLTETYVILFVILYLSSLRSWLMNQRAGSAFAIILLSIFIVLQRQTYLVFPGAALALVFWSDRSKSFLRRTWPIIAGLIAACVVYALLPKSYLQVGMIQGMRERWASYPTISISILLFASRIFQLLLAIGLFLTPLIFSIRWTPKRFGYLLGANVISFALIFFAPGEPITAGVLFTGYLPRAVGAIFVSLGVWGAAGVIERASKLSADRLGIIAVFSLIFLSFTVFFDASDVKYVLPVALSLLFAMIVFGDQSSCLIKLEKLRTGMIAYLIVVGSVSLLTNRYYLDTLDARFDVADRLESSGEKPELISAGYGRDSYKMGQACVLAAKRKISRMPIPEQAGAIRSHLIETSPRQYEDEAVFNYFVKPYVLFGKRLRLSENRLRGQAQEPIDIVSYSVFGLPNALAIYKNDSPQAAWCFR